MAKKQKLQPHLGLADKIVKWIGVATSLIGAVTALLLVIGKFGDAVGATCKSFPSVPFCSSITPLTLAPYDSPKVGGGHTQKEFCEPQASAYRSQHPGYEIRWMASEESNKDFLGKVTYKYHCVYAATPTSKNLGLWLVIAGFAIGLLAMLFVWRRQRTAKA
jgi:hypothetical protein